MDLSEKIKQILLQKNISPSLFADEIGIQRSSISHILAGRNKPSLDIVQKVVKRFPELGLNWILDDAELPDLSTEPESFKSREKQPIVSPKPGNTTPLELSRKKHSVTNPIQEIPKPEIQKINENKIVDRVMIFYTDGTFQEFKK